MRRTAILMAGQRPGLDRLAGTGLKALLPVAGRPMVARVVDTLLACPDIGDIVVLAQDTDPIRAVLPDDPRIGYARSGVGIAHSVAGVAADRWPLFVTTADHPLLRPETISAFLAGADDCDVAVGLVEERVVRRRFPDNRRTWLSFARGRWTGANLFALNGAGALKALNLWASVEQDRKKGWKLIARFGPWLLLRAATRTITIDDAIAAGGRRFGFAAKAVPLDDPLAAVDVDKPEDHVLAEAVLEGRA
ncbi:nucleotidyltransferase family protein [Sphingomonas quercus]|uniref:Nucleotidyltransferase family protein n=1 Tax=Sphingomonas quercus TaxID=2842451 RepID=A0ABS6BJG2_9SPHN|nr:nucleotidyltransferase family protein [Sphingomonas quercus]MBU3078319.1 nucleotidyltransferase family protein [Sphingomonas quercus]